jgi:hypothetical protein
MKFFSQFILAYILLATCAARKFTKPASNEAMDRYMNLLSSDIVNKLTSKAKKVSTENLALSPTQNSLEPQPSDIIVSKPNSKSTERKLNYESLTNSYLMGDGDETSTTNHLSMLLSQQKGMQNYRVVGNWLNDLENNLDDLRDAVNRRVSDLATGLERRNQLLGHYNYVGQGINTANSSFGSV